MKMTRFKPLSPRSASPKNHHKKSGIARRKARAGILFALPALILFGTFAFYPMARTLYLSFFQYDMLSAPDFVGWANYKRIISSGDLWASSISTIKYLTYAYIPAILIALLLAVMLNEKFKFRALARTLYFTPFVMSMVVVAVIWRQIFYFKGPLNAVLSLFGLSNTEWLTDSTYAPIALAILTIWRNTGFFMVLFLAGLQSIPDELYEAATIDGASKWQQFRYVTLGLLKPTTVFVVTMALFFGIQEFSAPFVLTDGGPANATNVLSLYTYKTAFSFQQMGQAAAISMVFFVILIFLTISQRKTLTALQDE